MDDQAYSRGDENCPYSWLNEWLCEYVDGTMDPSLQAVFEEYVRANPELEEHIERLRHTRELLCRCSDQHHVTDEMRARVQGQVECEMLRSPRSLSGTVKRYPVTTVASSVVVALVVGMFAGAALMGSSALTVDERTSPAGIVRYEGADRPPRRGMSAEVSTPYRFRTIFPSDEAEASALHAFGEQREAEPTPVSDTLSGQALPGVFGAADR